ncbi:MAG: family 20 glycosylhydrolase [Phycisphaerae bacterium]
MFYRSILMTICGIGTSTALGEPADARRVLPAIIPRPADMKVAPGVFQITKSTSILIKSPSAEARAIADYLAKWLRDRTGYRVTVRTLSEGESAQGQILLVTAAGHASLGDEYYALRVTPLGVALFAGQPPGLFRGVQTIRQLLPPKSDGAKPDSAAAALTWQIPCVTINDKPRYRWRGMLLDCGRHFMTKEFIKRYIDLLAYHKMNVLHWHLTEDQGWRIEIRKYPKLTEIGAWRGEGDQRYGGFYSQQDIKEIVKYAQSRYVTVVPEIEMPGHSLGALASYPELSCTGGPFKVSTRWGVHADVYCAGDEKTFEFLEDVLSEVLELFPSKFIHIGGDECPKDRWKNCPKCQARMGTEGLKDEHELQSYFIRRIEKFLNAKGRRLIGWDEILEGGLAPNATVQSWRGMRGAIAAATSGHDVVASPTSHCYLDYPQTLQPSAPGWMGLITLEKIYSFEPTPAELTPAQAKHILGAEGNIWTEHAPQDRVDHQVFPRLCALAEVTWSPAELRDWDDFSERMKKHYRRLDALGVNYYLPPPGCKTLDRVFADSIQVALENPLDRGEIRYTLGGGTPTRNSPKYVRPLRLADTTTVKAQTFLKSGNSSDVVEFRFAKQRPLEAVQVADAVPGLAYEYYEGSWGHLPDYSRLTPAAVGTATTFDLTMRKREDNFAVRFRGYLEVPADGIYTFYLTSDDGSRLLIGSEVVVDNDGLHAASEQRGQIILKAGKHPIGVTFFQAGGERRLEVSYEGSGVLKQPMPASVLWRTKANP